MNTNHVSVGAVLASRYELTAAMASGGMAQVWRAHDKVLNRPVAIKILHPHLATDDGFVTRFRREAISSARLQHSSIVAVYDTVSDNGIEAIVMELIEGRTLRTILDHARSLPPSTTVQIGMQIADALSVAHSHGVVHRDIKPANIMIDNEMRVVVTDFGIAKATKDVDLTNTGTLLGTAKYLAPEQVTGDPIDPRSDLYALGVVLFEALVGEPPFNAETDAAIALARIQGPVPRCRERLPSVPAALDAIIARAMAQHPDDRFERAVVMRDALAAADLTASAVDESMYVPAPRVTSAVVDRANPGDAPGSLASPSPTVVPPITANGPVFTGEPNPTPPPFPVDGTAVMTPDMIRPTPGLSPPARGRRGRAARKEQKARARAASTHMAPEAPARPRRRWFGRTFVALLFVAALVTAGLLAVSGGFDLGGVSLSGEPLAVVNATTLDPLGDNGEEREDRVGRAIDGDERTAWVTETYRQGLPQTKDGVGIAFAFDGRRQVDSLSIQSTTENWSAEFYILDELPPRTGWSDPSEVGDKIGEVGNRSGNTDIDLDNATGRAVMMWITDTGTTVGTDGTTRNRLQIIEAVFR
ncbi:MAG: protein kinase [Acidimicrobiia bacterium]|nr:protein kinase [Acidimicrobiia bacterium]